MLPTPTAKKKKPASVHTIGYEQTDFARFAERLAAAGVNLLLDMRTVPISCKPGFSKHRLAAALAAVQVEYRHMDRLGAPRMLRDDLRANGDWSRHERGYFKHLTMPLKYRACLNLPPSARFACSALSVIRPSVTAASSRGAWPRSNPGLSLSTSGTKTL